MNLLNQIQDNQLLYQGYLEKRTKLNQWKKKWFVLRYGQISYYADSLERKPIKVLNKSYIRGFSISSESNFIFAIFTTKSIIKLRCETETAFKGWIQALEEFYDHKNDISDSESYDISNIRKLSNAGGSFSSGSTSGSTLNSSGSLASSESSVDSSTSSLSLRGRSRLRGIPESDSEELDVVSDIPLSPKAPVNNKKYSEVLIYKGLVYLKLNRWVTVETILTNKFVSFVNAETKQKIYTIATSELADVVDFQSKKWLYILAENHRGLKIAFFDSEDHARWNIAFRTIIEGN